MRGFRLAGRDRRAVIALALLVGAWLIHALLFHPFMIALQEAHDGVAFQQARLDDEKALMNASISYPAALSKNEIELLREAPRLFDASDSARASAQLREYISSMALEAHVFVQSIQSNETRATGDGLLGLQVTVRADGDLAGIIALLHAVEAGNKLVRINRIAIGVTSSAGASTPNEVAGSETLELLTTMSGFGLLASEPYR